MKLTLTYGELGLIVNDHLANMDLQPTKNIHFVQRDKSVVQVPIQNFQEPSKAVEVEVQKRSILVENKTKVTPVASGHNGRFA